jgi:hypothetical protein
MWLILFAQQSVGLPDGSGWIGLGMLGPVLAWLFFWHLPAKDKQIADLVKAAADERERTQKAQDDKEELDRQARHESNNTFQAALATIINDQRASRTEDEVRHRQESKDLKAEFKDTLNTILAHCDREMAKVAEALRSELARLSESRNARG